MTKAFNWRQVLFFLGILLSFESLFMLVSAVVPVIYEENDLSAFLYSAAISCGTGVLMLAVGRNSTQRIGTREGYLIVGLVWILFSAFGMLPYLISGYIPSVTDAYFETMSGFTTTGASILDNIESLPHGLLFWRSLTHWLGGMGIVLLSMALIPLFGSGMRLYSVETTGPTHDKMLPSVKDTARRLWGVYLVITIIQFLLLVAAGMDVFDSVCHSFSTIATGGFSTKQTSIAGYSPTIHYIIILFMFISGINYALLYASIIRRDISRIYKDEEFKSYFFIVLVASLIIMGLLFFQNSDFSVAAVESSFRNALFQVVSVITTTGFATCDYSLWLPIIQYIILLLMFVGASASSTAGGIKVIRLHIIVKNLFLEFKRVIHPKAVMPVRVNKRVVPDVVLYNIYSFVTLFVVIVVVSTFVLLMCGLDMKEAFSSALAAITNVGPALGDFGPAASFSALNPFAKWFLVVLMLVGRLEIFTILLLFSPSFWKK